ncbi:protease SohB [Guyparkeria hydrothermalis]|uniref:protease SohB n=1 Tax=Guyparkeria TaxID=2035712 RepID=UPI0010AD41FE|nr:MULTISPECIES: protease SohB [Guyparkeria]MCL7751506.1 protease SohB [Guyparkeria hydrothermalis]TKA90549.1 protease SohB [Guyparkeria sp. SB14A]
MWPEYFLFLLKTLTLAVAVIFVVAAVISVVAQARNTQAGDSRLKPLKIRRLNDEIESRSKQLREALKKPDGGWKAKWADLRQRLPGGKKKDQGDAPAATEDKTSPAAEEKGEADAAPRTFVLRFHGDIRASAVEALREEVSAVLQAAEPGRDRVLLVLDSPGGVVPGYGLAAAQLARLRSAEIELVAVVDRVAASGGYMMAAVANRIVAAPFAIVGSIGVVAQLPNIHRLLKRNDIDVELHTAGQYKRTLTLLGENTEAGREKFREELEQTHLLFKQFLNRYRPQLDLDKLATGEHWYGEDALGLGLIDEIGTSDDLVLAAAEQGDAYEIVQPMKKRGLLTRLSASAQSALSEWRHPL